jgi:hypothetical protein
MNDSTSIASIGDLSKPANTLIEKISDAIGGIFKPYQIRRIAQAEAEAEKIHAVASMEVTELQRRALHRFIAEEAKRQQNIESITKRAIAEVSDKASPEKLEDDWIVNFFDKCRLISDEQMQGLWSRILAGEANSPGKYSKRTVNLLASLDMNDAELFSRLCSFMFVIQSFVPLIYDVEHPIYNDHGINFNVLSHLESIGLIQFENLAGFIRKSLPQRTTVSFYMTEVAIEFPSPSDNEMRIGSVLLTQAGQQLAPICGSLPREGFLDYVKGLWQSFGYKVE